jgi:1-acyl-sn-glycerol-3-phosphate acyltransferase
MTIVAALLRRGLWRTVLACRGGLRVDGRLPDGGCVVVANHTSHADTAALLAALPAHRRPVVAAAADYWFAHRRRAVLCRVLAAGFPVRRGGGGTGDLTAAEAMLRRGRVVIVYPEGTRSRDGSLGEFRSGAARLASAASVPLVPVGIAGTGELLPVHGWPGRARVRIRIGRATASLASARGEVRRLSSAPRADRAGP